MDLRFFADMPEHKGSSFVLALVLLGVFAAGLVYLARFTSTTGYPPYSSLGSGPDGTKLLFEALEATGKLQVSRDYRRVGEARLEDSAVLYLGVSSGSLATATKPLLTNLERIAAQGNRLIIGITDQPMKAKPSANQLLEKRWGVRIERDGGIAASQKWYPRAEKGGIERPFGSGSIVLLPDSQRLNNRNLAESAAARALAVRLIGNYRRVVFAEAHLGIVESGSVAGLVRHFHLQGLAAGLLLVAILFLWHRSDTFPPAPRREQERGAAIAGSETRAMLAGLLAKHIAPGSLLNICVAEWNRLRPGRRIAAADGSNDPLAAYLKIQNRLEQRKTAKS